MDLGQGFSGAVSGASAGSLFGPVGTGVGAVAGGLFGLFGKKKKKNPKTVSAFDPQQQQLYNDYMQGVRGEGQFADLFKFNGEEANKVFDQNVARPAYRSFNENIVPSITGQYRGNNLFNSSYSAGALSRAGRDVQEGLDAQRSSAMYQGSEAARNNRLDSINKLLQTSTFGYQAPQANNPSSIDQILGTLGPQAGEWFADFLKSKR